MSAPRRRCGRAGDGEGESDRIFCCISGRTFTQQRECGENWAEWPRLRISFEIAIAGELIGADKLDRNLGLTAVMPPEALGGSNTPAESSLSVGGLSGR